MNVVGNILSMPSRLMPSYLDLLEMEPSSSLPNTSDHAALYDDDPFVPSEWFQRAGGHFWKFTEYISVILISICLVGRWIWSIWAAESNSIFFPQAALPLSPDFPGTLQSCTRWAQITNPIIRRENLHTRFPSLKFLDLVFYISLLPLLKQAKLRKPMSQLLILKTMNLQISPHNIFSKTQVVTLICCWSSMKAELICLWHVLFEREIYFRSYLEERPKFWRTREPTPRAASVEPSPGGRKVERVEFEVTNCPRCTASQHVPKIGHCAG